tara:strand:- start:1534 stop:1761 length:228 start_codon:yes stop_codon:yes gene_type:complete
MKKGDLVHIPASTMLLQLDEDDRVVTYCCLKEPYLALLVSQSEERKYSRVFYRGEYWEAETSDIYERRQDANQFG